MDYVPRVQRGLYETQSNTCDGEDIRRFAPRRVLRRATFAAIVFGLELRRIETRFRRIRPRAADIDRRGGFVSSQSLPKLEREGSPGVRPALALFCSASIKSSAILGICANR